MVLEEKMIKRTILLVIVVLALVLQIFKAYLRQDCYNRITEEMFANYRLPEVKGYVSSYTYEVLEKNAEKNKQQRIKSCVRMYEWNAE
jgi:hypothetical protein